MKNTAEDLNNAPETAPATAPADDMSAFTPEPANASAKNTSANSAQPAPKFTEKIVGKRFVSSNDKEFVVVVTDKGNEVWIPKKQWDAEPSCDAVTFKVIKKGQLWFTGKDGTPIYATRDVKQFECLGGDKTVDAQAEIQSRVLLALFSAGHNPNAIYSSK